MKNYTEYSWFLSNPDLESEYEGQYIGIVEEAVIAHSHKLKEVLKKAHELGKEPYIYKVPPLDKLVIV
ncbi:MAG TPA: DUF5678 domain-containing protein [Thermodesulfovibrionia bacterium]|nr:DUF5678 domain-containing protein [Thermodesulfovibrionia bacterium]